MIKIRSPEAKKVAAEVLAEHDPQFLRFLRQLSGSFGPLAEIQYTEGPAYRELHNALTKLRDAT